ncbi:hypothetical protein D0809_00075 [Flavobacterium circumlabens]|uniref:Uncharacterized protein n=1 Tax=Flavobacterium circumlabens TaxID=2133765 RepID=A0A4Y7UGB0_9FLAO|nr:MULTISPECIES: hypothetical protein [Flavobacterium]QSB26516.1 hypothetical protein HAV12_019455 [Flavobacterium sp. CLA17]TCN52478.1 hypothetical protein EV142_11016 [Flavobacterium circumlabens]TEB45447.1 hypothetical protein D0809_00075 [Flavobacterium circumlabens]
MQNENQKTSHQDVVPSVVHFLSDLWFEGNFKEQPLYLQEIFELMLETEFGNDQELRQKMLSCLRTSRNLAETLSPFTDKQIQKACVAIKAAKAT